ncbi:MAG: prepilin-type N-terminal cleavage/methylation domain-containing protein [Deltaproteobacteria bacterium]|nr:prepilin-type N-terminal cleavage/methylation domain-containing protein [Deltaproteobacteria bacterium]
MKRDQGFTLLEVMVSLAILAMSLIVLIRIVSKNIQMTNRSKLITISTFLARAKIIEIEDRIVSLGFSDINETETGDFSDDGYPQISWTSDIERIELPTNLGEGLQGAGPGAANDAQTTGSQNPLQFMAGMMGGMMNLLLEPIRIGLQESIRRATVKVMWREMGRGEQTLEVATYFTDPARLDAVLQAPK